MRFLFCCIAFLFAANFLIYRTILTPQVLNVSILEVGPQTGGGSAILVRTPNDKNILINTGPDASILRALGTALSPWQRDIDTVVLTSTKTSETGGLQDVINRYHVSNFVRFGNTVPYGTPLLVDNVNINILSPNVLSISYGGASLTISSSTEKGIYVSNGEAFFKTK